MSHVSVKTTSAAGEPSLEETLSSATDLLVASIDFTRTIMEQAAPLFSRMSDLSRLRRPDGCCGVPEVDCPPRCVCHVTWEATAGEAAALTVRITNASKTARVFTVHATPFTGIGGSPGTISLTPASLPLQAGKVGIVDATMKVPTNLPPGDYEAEIVVRGAYEQAVRITLKVRSQKTCGEECRTCEVIQGERPVRIRAHHWYDHFQCTEPCIESDRFPGSNS